jgi:hypothetical protein
VGGSADNSDVGAAWVYTRSGGVWTQQGNKLVGTGAVGFPYQGYSVSISADGNTAIVGGDYDNSGVGAAWVYTRSGGVWTQQGNKLVGTGVVGSAQQGESVSISADGNTAIVGGITDNSNVGAAWVYTRSGGVWTQQGNKLVGSGAVGSAKQGVSVSLSADGNTAIVGGPKDNSDVGAAWVYTRSGGVWTQQGNKLVGTGAVGPVYQGYSVSISADGNTAIVGGITDNSKVGASWVYKRSGGVWSQQGNKLVGTGAVGSVQQQGVSVSISADGNTAIVGGNGDNSYVGAFWVYRYLPPAPTITSFAPVTAAAGAVISITGTNFTGTSIVTLGGTPVTSFTVVSSTSIVAIVGTGATGAVMLTTPSGSGSLAGFTFISAAPAIISFSASTGPVGTLVTITGTNLSNPTGITIAGVSAIPISNNGNTLVAMVMPGATSGGVSVTTAGGTANGSGNFLVTSSQVPNTQQGNKLVGTGFVGSAEQGYSISISADGNTAIVGGYNDNSGVGAAWVYTRSGGVWTQQGNKLVGTGAVGSAQQGESISISADGNTAIVGGSADNSDVGAAWVYTRSGGVWTQQGNKLVGTGAVGFPYQGYSVSISADGNTAIVGGDYDNSGVGAAWVYTRSGGVWTQQGNKLVGTGVVGSAQQGESVSISADGNTAIVGGITDNSNVGAAWVYTRSGGVWTQQGNKLVGSGAVGSAKQGVSVSLSADGNTAIVGGPKDNSDVGAAWVYTRSGGVWTQQGNKLVGTGAVGPVYQGYSVSISADGNTAIVGGITDNSKVGASWVYKRSGGVWSQQGNKLVGTGAVGSVQQQGVSVSISADGNTAIVGGNGDNSYVGAFWVYRYLPPAPTITSFAPVTAAAGAVISITGTNFTGTSIVTLGGTLVTSFTVVSSTSIVAIVGTGATGAVGVTSAGGSASLSGFTFIPAPVISSFNPTTAGLGTSITITGSNLTGATSVTLGGTAVSSFTVLSSTTIIAIVGTGSTGSVGVTSAGGSASLSGFTFIPAPVISSINPTTAGLGTSITITGSNLTGATSVTLGGTAVSSFTVVSSTTIRAIVGNGSTGSVGVTSAGGSASLSGFTFIPAPVISSFNPTTAGLGNSITITGSDLTGATSVTLGGTAVSSFTVLSSTTIIAIVGTGATGSVGVTSAGGSASLSGFTFIPAPVISSFNPTAAGLGTSITITGSNLTGATSVTLGGTPVASFTVLSSTTIIAVVGTGATGSVGVTSAGGSASLSGFTFIPAPVISSFNPTTAGLGATITITGSNFTGATSVTLEGTVVSSFTVLSSTTIIAVVGNGTSGNVAVVSPGGTAQKPGFTFGNPTLSINMLDSIQTFGAIKGNYSKVQNYSISGLYLQNDVQIVAPDSFQVSKSFGSGFSKNLVLSTIGGKLDTTKIYVRFKSDVLGNYSGNITHISTNALAKNISVVGNSNCDSTVYFTPIVNNISKDTIVCFRDSIVLSPTNGSFTFYKWSSGETSKNIVAKNSGSYKLQVGSGAGCLSNESIPIKLNKNTNPIPSIALVVDNLISTNSNAYRWYFNNNLLNGNNSNLLKPSKVGFYTVETSSDNICWDRSTDYPLISIPNSSIKDSIQIKTYPNPTSTGLFHVVISLTKNTNVTASVTVVDGNGNVLIQTSKLIFFGREIKIPITLSFKGTVFTKVEVNGVVKIQTVILQ